MRRDLLTRMYDWVAGIASYGPSPGASARNRWCAKRTWRFLQGESPCWVRASHPPIPSVAAVRKVVQEV